MSKEALKDRKAYIEFIDEQCNDPRSDFLFNGLGSNIWYLSWVNSYIPADIVDLFYDAAKWHDVAYTLGGSDEQRMFADTHFEQLIMDAAYSLKGYDRIRARFWARICFAGVRTGGELSFEHRPAPSTMDEYLAGMTK